MKSKDASNKPVLQKMLLHYNITPKFGCNITNVERQDGLVWVIKRHIIDNWERGENVFWLPPPYYLPTLTGWIDRRQLESWQMWVSEHNWYQVSDPRYVSVRDTRYVSGRCENLKSSSWAGWNPCGMCITLYCIVLECVTKMLRSLRIWFPSRLFV